MVISGEKGGAIRDLNGMATEISHRGRLPDLLGSATLAGGVCVSRLWAPGGRLGPAPRGPSQIRLC